MTYHRNQHVFESAALGSTAGDAITTAAGVATDPYFSETACRVRQLYAIENRLTVPPCTNTAPDLAGGIGLRKVIPILRAYVQVEQQPLLKVAGIAAVIGIPFLLGFAMGRR